MKKKALSLFMTAVMLATAPASVSLASEAATAVGGVESEVESETSAEEFAEENTAAEPEATDIIPDIQMADAAEMSADENEENTASESVGTDEDTGVSVEETTADEAVAEETATEETTAAAAAAVSAAAPEDAISAETESEETAEDETVAAEIAAEDGVEAASVEAAAVSEDSDLTLSSSDAIELNINYYNSTVYAVKGGTAVMTIDATVNYGSIIYEWYYYDSTGTKVTLGGNSNTVEVTDPSDAFYYTCCLWDDNGTDHYLLFKVQFVDALSLTYNDYCTAAMNEETTLSVQAVSPNGSLTYQWYVLDDETDTYTEISGATSANYVTTLTSPHTEYKCEVSDGTSTETAYIDLDLDTGLSVSTDKVGYLVETGGSATLSVSATTNYGSLSYSWYYYDDNDAKVEVGNAASLTLSNLTTTRMYYCDVSDGVASSTLTFWVSVASEIGETATSSEEAKTLTVGTLELGTIANSGDIMWFKIVPDETGSYVIYTSSEHIRGYFYDPTGTQSGSFSYGKPYTLTAGETYYLAVQYYLYMSMDIYTGTFYMYMAESDSDCIHLSVRHYPSEEPTKRGCYIYQTIEYWYCYYCKAKFSDAALTTPVDDVVTSQADHSWDAGTVTQAATCTTPGVMTYTCTECGNTKTETIDVTDHSWDAGTVTQAATCTTPGIMTYTCTVCGETKTETIAASGADHKSVTHTAAQVATCAAAGNIEYWYCADCGKYFSDSALTTEVSAGSLTTAKLSTHTFGDWTTTTAATVLATGTQTRTCSVCGQTETQTIAKLTPTITVNATSIKLKKKQSTTALKVSGLAEGDSVASWKSSNTKIVTVTSKGKITAKSKTGTAYITITLKSGLTKKVKVTVQSSAVKTTKITVPSKTVSIKKGKTYTIKPTISPITSVQKVTYSSSNKKVATVNSKGKITAKKKGTATITVKSGSKSVKIKVTVK